MLLELFSGNFFIVILLSAILLIITIGVYASLHYGVKEYNASHLSIFVRVLGALGILLLVLESMLLAVYNQLTLDSNMQKNYNTKVQGLFIQPFQLLTNEKIRPEFAASFHYGNLELFNQTKDLNSPITIETLLNEDLVFNSICQGLEDFLYIEKFQATLDKVWIAILLEYSHSKFFQEKWEISQFKYNLTTQDFINLLIKYANSLEIPVKTSDLYLKKAENLEKDPIFKKILTQIAG
jgi:hypothetical protein